MTENIKILNSNNQNIEVTIEYPENPLNKLAILCPGYLDSKDYGGLAGLSNVLAEHGFTVARFNPTGTWGSEGLISDFTTTQYLKDIKSVKEFLTKDKKYNSFLIAGHSMGGRMAILHAIDANDVSSVVGIMCSPTMSRRWPAGTFEINKRNMPENKDKFKEYQVPDSFWEDASKYNILDVISKLTKPLLLITGEKDTITPPEKVKAIFDKANKPKEFAIIPNIGHDYRHFPEQVKLVNNAIIGFLNTWKI